MVHQGFFEILMITLISSKNLGGYKIMRNTVIVHVVALEIGICLLIMSKIADVGMPETPTPLASANVGNGDTPPPLRHADVLNGWSLCKTA